CPQAPGNRSPVYSAALTRSATSAGTHWAQTSAWFLRNQLATSSGSLSFSSMCAMVSFMTGSGTDTLDRNSVSLGASCVNWVVTAVNTGFSGYALGCGSAQFGSVRQVCFSLS